MIWSFGNGGCRLQTKAIPITRPVHIIIVLAGWSLSSDHIHVHIDYRAGVPESCCKPRRWAATNLLPHFPIASLPDFIALVANGLVLPAYHPDAFLKYRCRVAWPGVENIPRDILLRPTHAISSGPYIIQPSITPDSPYDLDFVVKHYTGMWWPDRKCWTLQFSPVLTF